jgi:hypothetical protein
MMTRFIAGALASLIAAGAASAQLIGPIPPKPAAPQTTEPGPLGPVPEVMPPEGEPRAPSIIERDADGRLKTIDGSPEMAAVAKYPFDAERRAKIAASQSARRADVDKLVVTRLESVLDVRRLLPQVRSASDFETLFKARDAVAALRMEKPLDRLLRDGAITIEHKVRLEEAVREFDTARKKQIDADSKGDATRAAVLNLRQTFEDAAREPLESLDRQLNTLSEQIEQVLPGLTLRDDQRKATEVLRIRIGARGSIHNWAAKRHDMVENYWLDILDMEQKRAALIAARPDETPKP